MDTNLAILPSPDPLELAWYPTNDVGNARRLAARQRGLLRWVDHGRDEGFWIGYQDGRWQAMLGSRLARLACDQVADCLREEAIALAKQIEDGNLGKNMSEEYAKERLTELRKWANKSGNAAQARGMLDKAKAMLAIDHSVFDRDPLVLNVKNGTLRFVEEGGRWTVKLFDHNPEDMITRQAQVEYDPDATCPRWLKRLDQLQPDPEQREMFRRICGYAVQGRRSGQFWVVAQGKGGDGKSLTHGVLASIMGDYYQHADVSSFLQGGRKSGSDHSEDLARLMGETRLVVCDEPERNSVWNSKVLKQMTSGETMTTRALREGSRDSVPRFLMICEVNIFPRVPTSDDGFWRRAKVFQWPVQIPRTRQGDYSAIKQELIAEGPGVLNWALGGACDWLADRDLKESTLSKEVGDAYRNASDPFGEWYRARIICGTDASFREVQGDLHADFKAYCIDELGVDEDRVMKIRAFNTALSEKQHGQLKSNGQRFRTGLRLKTDAEMTRDNREAAEAHEAHEAHEAAPAASEAPEPSNDVDWSHGD